MTEPNPTLAALIDPDPGATPRFPPTSRYASTAIARMTAADGREIAYLRRRFIPQPDRFATITEYQVTQGDRLDRIAASELGDSELYWRLCDANVAIAPEELTSDVGRRLRITLPEGLPGAGR